MLREGAAGTTAAIRKLLAATEQGYQFSPSSYTYDAFLKALDVQQAYQRELDAPRIALFKTFAAAEPMIGG